MIFNFCLNFLKLNWKNIIVVLCLFFFIIDSKCSKENDIKHLKNLISIEQESREKEVNLIKKQNKENEEALNKLITDYVIDIEEIKVKYEKQLKELIEIQNLEFNEHIKDSKKLLGDLKKLLGYK